MEAFAQPGMNAAPMTHHRVQRIRRILGAMEMQARASVHLYEPLPNQAAFLRSPARERLLIGGNQTGKTLTALMDLAWAALGCHPYLSYPKNRLKIYVVGKDEQHLADPIYEKLTAPGAFEIIRDEVTNEWRSFRPATDEHRASERKPADPIIPPHMIEDVSWRLKKANVPKVMVLKNGTRIYFYPSSGKPKAGTQIDLALFDEEILDSTWYAETSLRLMRRGGRFIWSATPHTSSQGLLDLHERAIAEKSLDEPRITEHKLLLANNPHIPEAHKEAMIATITSPDEYLIRVEGEFATAGFLVYPEFNMKTHGCERFEIPKTWCRYLVIDPGYQIACALFFAVPPVEANVPQHVYLYDEIYEQNCDAFRFAELVSGKIKQDVFYEFIIDSHAARITPMAGGKTIGEQYEAAFKKFDVRCHRTGNGFVPGMDDVKAGNLMVHDWLYVRPQEGTPVLKVFREAVPNFEHEIRRYRKKQDKTNKVYLDDPQQKKNHAMDALRYARGRDLKWRKFPPTLRKVESLYTRFKKSREARRKPGESQHVNLGPVGGNAA